MIIRVWFSNWFSTAYNIIMLLKENNDNREFVVFGTSRNKDSVMLRACNYCELEPTLSGENYLDYCIDFCKRNKIDVFVPKRELETISKKLSHFGKIGTKVLVPTDHGLLSIIRNKATFYEECKVSKLFQLPDYFIVNNAQDFKEAYHNLRWNGKVCFKPVVAEGASGFRIIDDDAKSIENLFLPVNQKITFENAYSILSQKPEFKQLMVMEYIDGFEYSIDCLSYDGQLYAAIPRKKESARLRTIEKNEELIALAQSFNDYYGLPFIYNIQVRYSHGIPKLLEINARMSGGVHQSCLCGVNFPYLAILLAMGEKITVNNVRYGITVSQIDSEIIIRCAEHDVE